MCITTKAELRTSIRAKLSNMTPFERTLKSELIVDDIIASGIVLQYASILLYKAMDKEVNIDRLIDYAVHHGKRVYLPRVNEDELEIVQYPCQLKVGAYGILEPVGQATGIYPKLVITPVLGVDKSGNRLGKGKGYYDRYFERAGECTKIGVAFSEQVVDNVFGESHDIPLDRIFVR